MKTRFGAILLLLPLLHGSAFSQDKFDVIRAVPVSERNADWPRAFTVDDAEVMLYAPRVESWDGKKLFVRFAAGVKFPGATSAVYGSFRATADTITSSAARTVSVFNFTADDVRLDDSPERLDDFTRSIKALAPEKPVQVSLDELLAQTPAGTLRENVTTPTRTGAPMIVVKYHPSLLLAFDGKPVFRRVADSGLEAAVNTPATVLRPEGAAGPLYLQTNDGMWLVAPSWEGPWRSSLVQPPGLDRVPENHPVAQAVNQFTGRGAILSTVPDVIVTTAPAELIVFDGKPVYDRVADLPLARAANTETPVFFHFDHAAFFTVISGRWFSAADLPGPWSYVAHDQLPAEFAQIPSTDPSADVRANITGTREAQEAVVEAQIPEVARLRVSEAPSLTVDYDGEPSFEPITGTSLSYAVNTVYDVVRCENRYYCCHDGLWFDADAAWGAPWGICRVVPRGIYLIPSSCPLYHVRFCEVSDYDDDSLEYRCSPGYWGTYIDPYTNVCVFGTGYRYPSYCSSDYYCGRPWTYGYGCHYRRHSGFERSTSYIARTSWLQHESRGHYADLVRHGGRFDADHWHSSGGRSEPFTAWHGAVKTHAEITAEHHSSSRMEIRKPSDPKPRVVAHQSSVASLKSQSFDHDVRAGQKGELYRHHDSSWEPRDSGRWKESGKNHTPAPQVVSSVDHRSQPKRESQVPQTFVMPKGRGPQEVLTHRDDFPKAKKQDAPSHPKIEVRNDPPRTERRTRVEDSPPTRVEHRENAPQPQARVEHHAPAPQPQPQARVEHHAPAPQPQPQARVEHHAPAPQPQPQARVEHHAPAPQPQPQARVEHHAPAPQPQAAPAHGGDDKKDDKKKRH